jgi:hypothetical protein
MDQYATMLEKKIEQMEFAKQIGSSYIWWKILNRIVDEFWQPLRY